MANYWDPDTGFSYSGDDFGMTMAEWEEKRRKEEEAAAGFNVAEAGRPPSMISPVQEEPEEGYMPPVARGIQDVGKAAWEGIKGVATSSLPFAKEYGEWAGEHPIASKAVSLPVDMALRGGADVLGTVQEGSEAAGEAYEDPKAEVPYHDRGAISDVMRAIGAGFEAGTTPEALARTKARKPELMGEVADMPEVIDAAAIAMIPFTAGGSTASRLALWTNRVGRSVDALDAAIGAEQFMGDEPVVGAIRSLGGGVGATFGGVKYIPDEAAKLDMLDLGRGAKIEGPWDPGDIPDPGAQPVAAIQDLDIVRQLEDEGITKGITDGQYQQLEAAEARIPPEPTVHPVSRSADYPLLDEDPDMGLVHQRQMESDEIAAVGSERIQNMLVPSLERARRRAALLLDEPEIADLDLRLKSPQEDPLTGRYAGKRALGIEEKAESAILHDPVALARDFNDPEEFYEFYSKMVLEHEPAHARGLHPGAKGMEELGVEVPPGMLRRSERPEIYDFQGGVDPEAGRFNVGKRILEQDPEIQAIRRELVDNLRRSDVFSQLKAGRSLPTDVPPPLRRVDEIGAPKGPEDVDPIADDVARVEGDADAAILEADAIREARKADLTAQAGEIERAKAAAAGEKLSWRDWIAKNKKNPKDKKVKAEFEAYQKGEVVDYPPGKRPAKGKRPPGEKYRDIKWYDKARRSISNVKRAAPRAGRRLQSFVDTWDSKKARWIEDFRVQKDIIRGEKMNEDNIIRYLDGEEVHLPEPELKAAMSIRRLLREISHEADAADVLIGERAAYFPHMGPGPGRKAGEVRTRFKASRGRKEPHIEMPRTSKRTDWVRDLDVLDNYADNTARRISESTHLGKKHEKLAGEFAKYDDISPEQTEWLKKATAQITGVGARTARAPESTVRLAAALADLPYAAIYQPGQAAATAMSGGLRNSTKAAFKLLTDSSFRAAMKSEAARSGATLPDVVQELAGRVGDTKFMKGYLHGIPTLDRAMRVHAFATGKMLLNQADQGHAGARRLLDALDFEGVDTKVLTPEAVGRKLSDKTQFRTGPAEKPLWASDTGIGRFAWQYQHFAYHWGNYVGDVVRKQGIRGLLKLATIPVIAGEVIGDVRAILKGHGLEDEELGKLADKGDIDSYLKAITTRSKRFPLDHPVHRALQNFFMVGGAGIFFERGAGMLLRPKGELGDIGAALPATRRPIEIGTAALEAGRAGEVEPLTKELGRQIPGYSYSGWEEMMEEENARTGGRSGGSSGGRVGGRR